MGLNCWRLTRMATNRDFWLLQRLATQWDGLVRNLQVLNPRVVVVPDSGYEVFKVSGQHPLQGSTRIDMNPLALQVPERGNDPEHNIFIAVSGFLYFDTEAFQDKRLVVNKFGTRVAYFGKVQDRFDHVFGAHFDYSENELGHPLFHGQIRNLEDMFNVISSQLDVDGEVQNGLVKVLSTVRVPTAQLDVFSLLLQVFADHL